MGRNDLAPQEQIVDFIDQVIANVTSSGVFVLDRKTAKVITGNEVFAQIHGYSSIQDLQNKVYWDFLLPMDIQPSLATFQQNGYFQGEIRGFQRGNDILLLDFTILDIHRFDIILGLIRDITDQHNSIKRLKESEARYRTIVEDITNRALKLQNLADSRGLLLRMMLSESSEQLLLTQGWLDIIKTSLPEQHERVDKLINLVNKIIRFNRQIGDSEYLSSIIVSPLLYVSVPEFIKELNELITPIISTKNCQVKFNLQLEQSHLFECPRILTIAVEQIIQNSLARSCQEIIIEMRSFSENQLEILIIDNGRTPEPPDASKFLVDIYLSDVLLGEIRGKLTVTNILPKEGLQFSLIFPSKTRES